MADKIRAQVAALVRSGVRMDLFHIASGAIACNGKGVKSFGAGPVWRRLTYYLFFYFGVARLAGPLDFLYVRYRGSSPRFLWMLRRLRRANPALAIVVELPSYPYHTETVSLREKVLARVDRACRGALAGLVDRIVTFSREDRIFGVPTIRTDNGVDVQALRVLPRAPSAEGLRLLGVANLSFWHGYDRVIAGMADYYARGGTRDIFFDVVGSGAELGKLREQALATGLAERVRFWGPRRGQELEEIVARCHVGISSIGMHRLQVDTSNLKSREFCARGLPFAIGYPDRDFPGTLPFVFQAPATDDALDIEALAGFLDRLGESDPDYPRTMRAHAERNLTWHAKMQPVVEWLRHVPAAATVSPACN
ncbi:hypothetical protein HK414_09915 [Ramlibacter terrae]|uniref:Glycosyltransferase family 1 protein n=1 Tax=Ramlibacter terrae TaxID=2732511 RepID=A0ABX6P214_9BURK|nr:hypothetical protein HK414_09915 [Ramlibacter terrae]